MLNDFYTTSPDYSIYIAKLMELKTKFPFVQVFPIGESVLGRQIFALSIGNTSKVTLMAGAFHAQEWLTTTLLVRFFEEVCHSFSHKLPIRNTKLNSALSNKGLLIVPMVNPDGVQIALGGADTAFHLVDSVRQIQSKSKKSWQANANGVDINHNFDAGFDELKELEISSGICAPSPRQYGGPSAHSEPETRAMVSLLNLYDVKTLYAFHSQGEEIFYEYGINTPAKSRYIAEILALKSGYKIVQNDGLYSHGGYKDYFIERFKRSGFTIEIGNGQNPLPINMLNEIYDKILTSLVVMTVI